MPTITHIPSFITVAHTKLWIFVFFVISQSEQICKWGIKCAHLVTTDNMGSACVHTTHIPSFVTVAHTKLWIFSFFVISQSEQTCKWGIKYAHSVTTDHVGSTCAHHYPHTKFCHCIPYRTLDIFLFVISQSEQICKWGIKYAHSVTTDHMGSTCAPTTHIPSFTKIGYCVLIREAKIYLFCWWATYIHRHWGGSRGGRVPPLTVKNLPKIRKKREKRGKIRKVLSFCPSWQIGLATLLHPSIHTYIHPDNMTTKI